MPAACWRKGRSPWAKSFDHRGRPCTLVGTVEKVEAAVVLGLRAFISGPLQPSLSLSFPLVVNRGSKSPLGLLLQPTVQTLGGLCIGIQPACPPAQWQL
jgi:hypothetical protein